MIERFCVCIHRRWRKVRSCVTWAVPFKEQCYIPTFLVKIAKCCPSGLGLICCVPLRPDEMQDSKHSRKPWQDAASTWT